MSRRVPGHIPGSIVEVKPVGFDPVVVHVKAPTQGEKRDHLAAILADIKVSKESGDITFNMGAAFLLREKALSQWVAKVDGYADAAGIPIMTAQDLWERGEVELCALVHSAIEELLSLSPDSKKNLEQSLGSSSVETKALTGIAVTAEPVSSAGLATATIPGAILSFDTSSRSEAQG